MKKSKIIYGEEVDENGYVRIPETGNTKENDYNFKLVAHNGKNQPVENDYVFHPSHYLGIKIKDKNGIEFECEAIDLLDAIVNRANLSPAESGSLEMCLKYILRLGKKGEDGIEKTTDEFKKAKMKQDIKKACFYLNHCSELMDKD